MGDNDNRRKISQGGEMTETPFKRTKKFGVRIRDSAGSFSPQMISCHYQPARPRNNLFPSPTTYPGSNATKTTNQTFPMDEQTPSTSTSHSQVNRVEESAKGDDEVMIVHEAGINPIYPTPVITKHFQEYLIKLQSQNVNNIIELRRNPPLAMRGQQSVSHLFITLDDLREIKLEITRALEKMSVDEQHEFSTSPQASFKMLILHDHLTSCILRAKQCAVRDHYQLYFQPRSTLTFMDKQIDEVAHCLYWQTGVFNDFYRQSKMTTFSNNATSTQSHHSSASNTKTRSRKSSNGTKKDVEQLKQLNAKKSPAKNHRKL